MKKLITLFLLLAVCVIGFTQTTPQIDPQEFAITKYYDIELNKYITMIGDSDSEVSLQTPPATDYQINPGESFSAGCWFRCNVLPGNGLLSYGAYDTDTTKSWWAFRVHYNGPYISLDMKDATTGIRTSVTANISGLDVSDGQWHYALFSVDLSAGTADIYVDNNKRSFTTSISQIIDNTVHMVVGGTGYFEWNGDMDNLHFVKQTTSQEQYDLLYAGGVINDYLNPNYVYPGGVGSYFDFNKVTMDGLILDKGNLHNHFMLEPDNHTLNLY